MRFECDTSSVDWQELLSLFKLAKLGGREGDKVRRAFENSTVVCFAFDGTRLVAAARALSDGEYHTTSTGVYGQVRYFVSDALHFDVGARYTSDRKDYEFTSATINSTFVPFDLRDSHRWSALTPRVAVGYDINRSLNWYASAARGYKSGGHNTFAVPLSTYNPEYVTTYETGYFTNILISAPASVQGNVGTPRLYGMTVTHDF